MTILPIDTTSLYLAMSPGVVTISMNMGSLSGMLPITVVVNPRDICGRAVGSILLSGDATPIFLGNVSPPSEKAFCCIAASRNVLLVTDHGSQCPQQRGLGAMLFT